MAVLAVRPSARRPPRPGH